MAKTLLISDMSGYGKVALSAMMPVMTARKQEIYTLPTALASNTFDYGKAVLFSTGEYVNNTLEMWDSLGFDFDAVFTGFIADDNQAQVIAGYCEKQATAGTKIFTDPIMGDMGQLYPGISDKIIECMRKTVSVSDYIMPNMTEAAMLTGTDYSRKLSKEETFALIDKLRGMGAKNVVITSCITDDVHCCAGYDYNKNQYFIIPFEYIDVRIPGTGDTFSSVIIADIMNGMDFETAVKDAMDTVYRLIMLNKDNPDLYKGMEFEKYLEEI